MTDLTKVSLETIAGGKAPAIFAHLLEQVLENIRDPNTEAQEVRSITLTFKLKPNKARNEAACRLQSKVKLASVEDYTGAVFMRHTKDGTVATTHDTKQEELSLEVDVVDGRTGEVLDITSRRSGS